jgi:phospholipid transport system substrate-binding protein
MPMLRIFFCTCLLVLMMGTTLAAAGPADIVRIASDEVLVILQDQTLSRSQRWQQVSRILRANFDFEGISRSVLATKWHEAKLEEQREFVRYFSQYLEETYRTRIEEFNDQRIRIDSEKLQGDRALVDTTIVSSDVEIPVNYRMRRKEGKWLVYDVLIEGQSMVSSYRDTFNAIAHTSGMQGLLDDVKRRIEKHRKAREGGTE